MKTSFVLTHLSLSLLLSASLFYAQGSPATPPTAVPRPTVGGQRSASNVVALLEKGTLAPDFVSKDVAGKEVRLSDWRKKVVVLDFWATWCGPCKVSLPHTQETAQRYKDQGVVVLAVCTSDTRDAFEKFVATNQQKYADIIFTSELHERGSANFDERPSKKLYGVRGIPTQFIIGSDGKIGTVLVGYSTDDERLEAALARAGVPVDAAAAARGEAQIKKSEEATAP